MTLSLICTTTFATDSYQASAKRCIEVTIMTRYEAAKMLRESKTYLGHRRRQRPEFERRK